MFNLKSTLCGALLVAPLLFSGCYPEKPGSISEYDIVYTDRSPSFDFKAANTYSLPDSIVLITGDLAEGDTPTMVKPLYADQILDRIRQNMNSRGWTEVAVSADPDVRLLPSAIKTKNVNVYSYYGGYWGWYYPYYGWGWYYPGYYPTYTSYTSGTLVLQMTDPNNISAANNIPVVWIAVLDGLLEGSTTNVLTRMLTNVDQAFAQSDYLKH